MLEFKDKSGAVRGAQPPQTLPKLALLNLSSQSWLSSCRENSRELMCSIILLVYFMYLLGVYQNWFLESNKIFSINRYHTGMCNCDKTLWGNGFRMLVFLDMQDPSRISGENQIVTLPGWGRGGGEKITPHSSSWYQLKNAKAEFHPLITRKTPSAPKSEGM